MGITQRLRWWLKTRRCNCGKVRVNRGFTTELGDVRHGLSVCYRCDLYGNPL